MTRRVHRRQHASVDTKCLWWLAPAHCNIVLNRKTLLLLTQPDKQRSKLARCDNPPVRDHTIPSTHCVRLHTLTTISPSSLRNYKCQGQGGAGRRRPRPRSGSPRGARTPSGARAPLWDATASSALPASACRGAGSRRARRAAATRPGPAPPPWRPAETPRPRPPASSCAGAARGDAGRPLQ